MTITLLRLPRGRFARACLAFLAAALGVFAQATDLRSTYDWQPVRIGGGGWVTGLVVHPTTPDLVVARTDVGGAYKWDAATASWIQLVTAERFPADFINTTSGNPGVSRTAAYQVESVALAPSDPSRLFLAVGSNTSSAGRLFRSTDGGASFTLTNLAVPMAGNADFRYASERLAIKPDDASVVLFGSRNAGLWRSTDGGVNWTLVPAAQLPFGGSVNGTPVGINAVLFDLATPSRVYASAVGEGVYRSDDAGLTWTQILGGGLWPYELEISQGLVFAAGPRNGFGVRRYDPAANTWSTRHPAGDTDIHELAVDRANASRLYASAGGFRRFYRSIDGGLTWTSLGTHTNSAAARANFQSPFGWKMTSTLREWLSMGTLAFDPHQPGRLWFAEGMGVWRADDIADTNPAPVFHDVSHGIEEMVATDAIALPGGKLVTAVWDRLGFVHTDLATAPAAQLGLSNKFVSGWALATSPAAPDFVAAIGTDHHNANGVMAGRSFDGGVTWTRFGSITAAGVNTPSELRYGELVASATNVNHLAWLPRHGAQILRYTTDGGATWQNSSVTLDDWNAYFFGNRRRLAADGATGGKFYLYQWTNGAVLASTDGGASFTDTGGRLSSYTYHSQLKGVPGHANHLWFAAGRDLPAATNRLRRSTDGGATWQSIAFFDQAWAFGYGKAAAPGGYPTLFVYGRAASGAAWGVWRSSDAGASWARVADYPLGLFDIVTTVTGDPEVFGKVYVGFSGNSFAAGAPADATPPPPPPAPPAAPVASPRAGRYPAPLVVTLYSATPEATVLHTLDGSSPATGSPVLAPITLEASATVRALARRPGATDSAEIQAAYTLVPPAPVPGQGSITHEYWFNQPWTRLETVTFDTAAPDQTGSVTSLESPVNIGLDNFGQRLRGHLTPTTSALYTFWLASDNHGELRLSTDADPANAVVIASVNGFTAHRQWTKYTSQRSAPIALAAGQRYYIEARAKDNTGGDHLSVAWRTDSATPGPADIVPGSVLSPWGAPAPDAAVFHFETAGDTLGWQAASTHVTALASGATPAHAGLGSLRVDFAKTGTSFDGPQVRVANVHGTAGRTVTFRVRVPALTGAAELLAFTQYGGNWTWRSHAINPTLDAWNTLTLDVPATDNVQTLGIWLRLADPQTGTLHLDAVNY